MQIHSNPATANHPFARHDVEVFFHNEHVDCLIDNEGEELPSGWYYVTNPDDYRMMEGPFGPYESSDLAIEAARGAS